MTKLELWQLRQRQQLPLDIKITLTLRRITEFYEFNNGNVYVSFSGGKDSTVLLHLIRSIYPHIKAVFVDTGLEYPEIREFVKTVDNVEWLRPKMNFKQVIDKYGYPAISKKVSRQIYDLQNPTSNNAISRNLYLTGIKQDGSKTKNFRLPKKWLKMIDKDIRLSDKCCYAIKKSPINEYTKLTKSRGFVGTMASDSNQRESSYLLTGCNNFTKGISAPLSFWTEQDIWDYIHKFNVPYCKIYDTGVKRTGCMFCMFGVHLEKQPNRFQLMKITHPQLYDYCINKLGCGKVLDKIGVKYD